MNYISLGYFCSVASELEEFGLRTESSPFDWSVSSFEGIILAISEHFKDFLTFEYLFQNKIRRAYYKNVKYNIEFYHDFNKYEPLAKQLPKVQAKYARRIQRFYQSIKSPTCFVRYISDEEKISGKSKELLYIENNYEYVLNLIKSFNIQNNIIFIANEGVESSKIKIYNVSKDKGDSVARKPLRKNAELFNIFNNADTPNKQANIERFKKKKKKVFFSKLIKKIKAVFLRFFLREYIHEKQQR